MPAKKFIVPFAATGNKKVVPDTLQPDGTVSYAQGYGPDYELDKTLDPINAKDIPRDQMNQLFFDATDAIGEQQLYGAALWSADRAPYPLNALAYHSDKLWFSNVSNNQGVPGVSGWDSLQNGAFTQKQSNVTDSTPGKLLLAGAFGIGGSSPQLNINIVSPSGVYRDTGSAGGAPDSPTLNLNSIDGRGQVSIDRQGNRLLFRGSTAGIGDTWTAWRNVLHDNNIVGEVSQSAGVPTGAIIERGSNGNGDYTRFADGTQITYRTIDFPAQQQMSTGYSVICNHPASFTGDYDTQVTPLDAGGGIESQQDVGALLYNGIYMVKSHNAAVINSYSYRSTTSVSVKLQVKCTGRWF